MDLREAFASGLASVQRFSLYLPDSDRDGANFTVCEVGGALATGGGGGKDEARLG
jgi:hypothetical protein